MTFRSTPPPIKDPADLHLELRPCQRFSLDNGLQVYAIDAGAEEVLQVDIVFQAGNSYEEKNGLAPAVNFLLKNGTPSRSAFEINEFFDYHGAYLNRNCHNETADVVLHCLNKHLPELLPVMCELLTEAEFPAQELDIYRQNMKQRLDVNLQKCDFVANRLIDEYLWGFAHPYGRYSTHESYDALDRNALRVFYNKHYACGHATLFVAGLLPKDIEAQLNRSFGQLPLQRKPLAPAAHPTRRASERRHRIINQPDGVQGAIRMGRSFPNRHHPDYPGAMVLNALFGGFFGSRLMENIREDKGYTYGIYSFLQHHLTESAWMVSTEAGREVCEATIEEVYREMHRLREEEIPTDELQMVRNYLMGTLLGELDGPFQIIGRWKNLVLNGLDEGFFTRTIETIRSISDVELKTLANRYLQEETFYELLVI
ncbi:MAG: insulinase family protein [Bacteroidetes bacterium]|nr:insulinase family protein [Bacteroidota bacterium]